jgi:hypothetical protein
MLWPSWLTPQDPFTLQRTRPWFWAFFSPMQVHPAGQVTYDGVKGYTGILVGVGLKVIVSLMEKTPEKFPLVYI